MNPKEKLSPHFTVWELTYSITGEAHGLTNEPNQEELANLKRLSRTLEEIRTLMGGRPVTVSSGFRNEQVNRLVGGSATSEHRYGRAADIIIEGRTNEEIMNAIIASKIPYNQIIDEEKLVNGVVEKWVHISIPEVGKKPKMQKLMSRGDGKYPEYVA